jgi:DNA modification methylase
VNATLHVGDCAAILATLAAGSVHVCVTSPPYWGLRDYGHAEQLGLEPTPEEYVARMVGVFREVRRVLRDDGTLWLNLGDSYVGNAGPGGEDSRTCDSAPNAQERIGMTKRGSGLKPKDLCGIPWRVAFALQADGWYLRSDIIWAKPNPRPESVTDRPTKAHEYLFLLSKGARYFYDAEAVKETATSFGRRHCKDSPGPKMQDARAQGIYGDSGDLSCNYERADRNLRTVWSIATQPYSGAHFAVMPPALVEPCIKAGSPAGGLVLDPFSGAGTVGLVAMRLGRSFVGCELNSAYAEIARSRLFEDAPLYNVVETAAAPGRAEAGEAE